MAMQNFLDELKEFAISNPNKTIDYHFVYSNLISFNIDKKQLIYQNIKLTYYESWKNRYKNINNLRVDDNLQGDFCWFFNSGNVINAIKMYIPMDYDHIKEGANQLFDFISSTNMIHQSKIASGIRNDNVVIRVNSLDDAKKIADFVSQNPYIQQGMLKVNPFLPNYNGIGMVMDNRFSFNSELSKLISSFIEMLKSYNRLDLLNVKEFNKFIINQKNNVQDLDLKDIYSLLQMTTSGNFEFQQFINHSSNKLVDDYDNKRNRIVDPNHYLERAIEITEKNYPGNSNKGIIEYLKGNPNLFTRKDGARDGLIKYVNPGDLINAMRTKLSENHIDIPMRDQELIDKYLGLVLNKQNNYTSEFQMIQNAYKNTMQKYNETQAKVAFENLYLYKNPKYFTNQYGDRTKLSNPNIIENFKKIVLSNIDINNIDINNISDVLNRFTQTLSNKENVKKNY